MVLDGAGWHGAKALEVPPNVTLVPLPPYSPQLNPMERVWLYLRERFLSLRILANDSGDGPLSVTEIDGVAVAPSGSTTLASGATVTLSEDGASVTYDPNGAFDELAVLATGADSLVYTVAGGNGGSDEARGAIRVNADQDADGLADFVDNARFVFNPDQRDTDGDGFGNIVDPGVDQDGIVTPRDIARFAVPNRFTALGIRVTRAMG